MTCIRNSPQRLEYYSTLFQWLLYFAAVGTEQYKSLKYTQHRCKMGLKLFKTSFIFHGVSSKRNCWKKHSRFSVKLAALDISKFHKDYKVVPL